MLPQRADGKKQHSAPERWSQQQKTLTVLKAAATMQQHSKIVTAQQTENNSSTAADGGTAESSTDGLQQKAAGHLERGSENIHISANSPSLGIFFRLQGHIMLFIFYSAVRVMKDASEKFTSLQELLKSAIFHRQQLKYEQTRRCGSVVATNSACDSVSRLFIQDNLQ
nr:uncharacterized protein LOC128696423 [Cherax quadricarinatus]